MRRDAQAVPARMARWIAGRLRDLWLRRPRNRERGQERGGAQRDSLASYSQPARRSNEPPYASLRQ